MLMVSAADLLRKFLINEDVVKAAPVDIATFDKTKFAATTGGFPTSDLDRVVALVDTGAVTQGKLMRGERITFPTVSISVKGPSNEGFAKGQEIEEKFDSVGIPNVSGTRDWKSVVIGANTYRLTNVMVTSPTMRVGLEEQNRRQVYSLLARLTAIKL